MGSPALLIELLFVAFFSLHVIDDVNEINPCWAGCDASSTSDTEVNVVFFPEVLELVVDAVFKPVLPFLSEDMASCNMSEFLDLA